ncbi:MAG: DUF4340 domain-containing protein [Kiritimatiellae bacterium]|nr:DUF4340 domain-containing protein [Kiritimatiellia bacterium]
MKTDKLLKLLVTALVLIAIAMWMRYSQAARRRPADEVGAVVVPALQKAETLNAVAGIEFIRADSTVRVTRTGGRWVSPDRYGHPVKAEEVRKFLLALADLRVGQAVPGGDSARVALELLPPALDTNGRPRAGSGTLVRLVGTNGAELASVILGKNRRRGGETGFADGRFVLAGGKPALVAETFSGLPTRPEDWMNTQLVDLFSSDIDTLTWTPPAKPPLTLTNIAGELKLANLATNETMDSLKVSRLSGIVSWLRFAQVADPSLPPSETGLDQPAVLVARAKNGREFTVKIGREAGTNAQRYVSVSAAFAAPKPLPAAPAADASEEQKKRHEEETKKIKEENEKIEAEIRELNERTARWVYLVEGSRFENLPQERKDLLQPPPAPASTSGEGATNAAPASATAPAASGVTNAPSQGGPSTPPPAAPSPDAPATNAPPGPTG